MQNQTTIFVGLWNEKLINSSLKSNTEVYNVVETTSDEKKAKSKAKLLTANGVLAVKALTMAALEYQNELVYFINSKNGTEILKVISAFNLKPQITIKGDLTESIEKRIKEIYADYSLTHKDGLIIVANKAQKATIKEEEKK
jgi:hypothetical protein